MRREVIWWLLLLYCSSSNERQLSYSDAAKQLYEDLIWPIATSGTVNVLPRRDPLAAVNVTVRTALIRIIELNEVSQVMTANIWMELTWKDYRLEWNPADYSNVTKITVPAEQIWLPDLVLYNNAYGFPQITIMSDPVIYYDGMVIWNPPAIFNGYCGIDIQYFPYDEQLCDLKFGCWTHTMDYIDLFIDSSANPIHAVETDPMMGELDHPCPYKTRGYPIKDGTKCVSFSSTGMDVAYYQMSAEWDLLGVEARRQYVQYPGCCGADAYVDITYSITLRRKRLFFTVNLVVPCMLIAVLTTFVFYLPTHSKGHKITFAISILVTLTFFFLLMTDLVPPTSLVIPLIGKYLLFTIVLVAVSIFVSVITLNLYHRNGSTHRMPNWVRWLFLEQLPHKLLIKPKEDEYFVESSSSDEEDDEQDLQNSTSLTVEQEPMPGVSQKRRGSRMSARSYSPLIISVEHYAHTQLRLSQLAQLRGMHPDVIRRMIDNVSFIAEHYRAIQAEDKVSEDWSYVAMVIDRLFLILFTIVNIIGTVVIILQAPSLYDTRPQVTTPLQSRSIGAPYRNMTGIPVFDYT